MQKKFETKDIISMYLENKFDLDHSKSKYNTEKNIVRTAIMIREK